MNIWKEQYPTDIKSLIMKCEKQRIELENKLNSENCKILDELYCGKEKIYRNTVLFNELGYTPNMKQNNELKGLYVFGETNSDGIVKPIYVGISRSIYRRLKQHGWGRLHNQATFAYAMAAHVFKHNGERKHLPLEHIDIHKSIIKKFKVAIYPELMDYDLYFMEVYLSGMWKTMWNSFRTH